MALNFLEAILSTTFRLTRMHAMGRHYPNGNLKVRFTVENKENLPSDRKPHPKQNLHLILTGMIYLHLYYLKDS